MALFGSFVAGLLVLSAPSSEHSSAWLLLLSGWWFFEFYFAAAMLLVGIAPLSLASATPQMQEPRNRDKLAELQKQGFYQTNSPPVIGGKAKFESDLYPRTSHQLTVQVYAADQQELQREIMPVLEVLLPRIDDMVRDLGEIDGHLAMIILFQGKVGLHFWARSVNSEFTALYELCDGRWAFQKFGEIHEE